MTITTNKTFPAWARWIAQDADGAIWVFEHEPNEGATSWYENEVGRYLKVDHGEANPQWRDSLVKLEFAVGDCLQRLDFTACLGPD